MTDWAEEALHGDFRTRIKIGNKLHESTTEHQSLLIFENSTLGRVLMLDGVVQTTERDEFIYHEMLAHQSVLGHGAARDVLIIGGGDGGALEEVCKHRSIDSVTMVEIDRSVIDLSQRYLPSICGEAFDDPRLELVIADGRRFVAETEKRFDVVIVDSTDPIGPGVALYTSDFYAGCKRCLRPGGVLVTQNGVPFLQGAELTKTVAAWRSLFADARCYLVAVPTYVGGVMALGWASDDVDLWRPPLPVLEERFEQAAIETRYYTPAVHQAAFALPPFIQELMS